MTKYLLLTGYDDRMAYIGHLTAPLMLAYATRQGMDFKCIRNYEKGTSPNWQKMIHILEALSSGYTGVLWIDADVVITNFALAPWKKCTSGIHISQDWGSDSVEPWHFSTGNFVAANDTIPIWEEALKREKKWANQPLWEQSCLRELYAEFEWVRDKISIFPRRCYNPVLAKASTSTKAIPKEPWEQGDWLCHLTGLGIEQRIAAFYDLLPKELILGLSKSDYQRYFGRPQQKPSPAFPVTNCLSDR